MSVKTWIISSFREIFLYHHRSLEFRAKVFALMIAACFTKEKECNYNELKEVANNIYPNDKKRQQVLIHTTKEYVQKILSNPKYGFDEYIKDINLEVKTKKDFIKKIDLEDLKKFINNDIPEEKRILQLRIYEFFENLIKDS